MKQMMRAVILMLCSLVLLVGCSASKAEIALIARVSDINNDPFNKSVWEGIVKYAEENKYTTQLYPTKEITTEEGLACVEKAVENGAKVVVAADHSISAVVAQAQELYPEVDFILVDGDATNEDGTPVSVGKHTVIMNYAEEQAGFLAGYAMVQEGYTTIGFIGGEKMDPVDRYGYGYVMGAEYAAQELALPDESIQLYYTYTNSFDANDQSVALAQSWYEDGVQVIFACGGAMGDSVIEAAETVGAKVIGVDADQSGQSATVITSATKGLSNSVYTQVKASYENVLQGGSILRLDASDDGVGLAMETAKFKTFTQEMYDTIFAKLANNTDKLAENLQQVTTKSLADFELKAVVVDEQD